MHRREASARILVADAISHEGLQVARPCRRRKSRPGVGREWELAELARRQVEVHHEVEPQEEVDEEVGDIERAAEIAISDVLAESVSPHAQLQGAEHDAEEDGPGLGLSVLLGRGDLERGEGVHRFESAPPEEGHAPAKDEPHEVYQRAEICGARHEACRHADTADHCGSNLAVHNSRQKGVSCARGGDAQEVDDEVEPRERRRVIRLVLALALALALLLDLRLRLPFPLQLQLLLENAHGVARSARPVNAARAARRRRGYAFSTSASVSDRRTSVASDHGVRQSGRAAGARRAASRRRLHQDVAALAAHRAERLGAGRPLRRVAEVGVVGAQPLSASAASPARGDCRRCRTDRRRGNDRPASRSIPRPPPAPRSILRPPRAPPCGARAAPASRGAPASPRPSAAASRPGTMVRPRRANRLGGMERRRAALARRGAASRRAREFATAATGEFVPRPRTRGSPGRRLAGGALPGVVALEARGAARAQA